MEITLENIIIYILTSSILASLATVLLSNWLSTKKERKRLAIERVEHFYLDNGLFPILGDLSKYGDTCFLTLSQIATEIDRKRPDLNQFIEELRRRHNVIDLLEFNWRQASPSFHRLYRFGTFAHTAVVNGFYSFSRLMQDGIDIRYTPRLSSKDLGNSAGLAQQIKIFLERKLLRLSERISEMEYKHFSDFLKKTKEDMKIKKLHEDFKDFYDRWRKWSESTDEERKATSLEFSTWLNNKIEEDARKS